MQCRLCSRKSKSLFQGAEPNSREFYKCSVCHLVSKPESAWLTSAIEKSRYVLHENDFENDGYVQFLTPVVEQICQRAKPGSRGLDYGCGPTPVLAQLLNQNRFETEIYDPYFFPRDLNAVGKFDFVTCTEAAEHFREPGREFDRLFSLLNPGGFLVIMTHLYDDNTDLNNWYYARDPTHIVFYSRNTVQWIAQNYHFNVEILGPRTVLFTNGSK